MLTSFCIGKVKVKVNMGDLNADFMKSKNGLHKIAIQEQITTLNGQINAIVSLKNVFHIKTNPIQLRNPIFNFDNHPY